MTTSAKDNRAKRAMQTESYLLVATALLSGIVSLLDLFGLLEGIGWLQNRVPSITLLIVSGVAAYLVTERRSHLEVMQNEMEKRFEELVRSVSLSTTTIIQALNGVELRVFDSGREMMKYINTRLSQTKIQVDDLSWSSAIGLGFGLTITQEMNEEYAKQVERLSKIITFREVFMFNRPGRIEKLEQRIAENSPGYSCAFYASADVPLLQFMIIDKEELFVLSDQLDTKLATRHPVLVRLFSDYYEDIWKQAKVIKHGPTIKQDILRTIRDDKPTVQDQS